MDRRELVKQLVERFRRRPRFLTVKQTVQILRRLISGAVPGGNGCALWSRATNGEGYGIITMRLHGRWFKFYVHRLADQFGNDPSNIPPWMEIDHEACDTPPCFHPDHVVRKRRLYNRRRSAENTNRKKAERAEQREAI